MIKRSLGKRALHSECSCQVADARAFREGAERMDSMDREEILNERGLKREGEYDSSFEPQHLKIYSSEERPNVKGVERIIYLNITVFKFGIS